jgi:hypothetical protein
VHDAARVGRLERTRQLHRDVEQGRQRNRPFPAHVGQGPSPHELHRQEVPAASLFNRVDGDDVRVLERGKGPGLPLESIEPFGLGGNRLGEQLQRDVTAEPRVDRPIDLAHAPGADGGDDLVRTKSGAGGGSDTLVNTTVSGAGGRR